MQKVREGKVPAERVKKLLEFVDKIKNQEDMKAEYQKLVSENFWDLI